MSRSGSGVRLLLGGTAARGVIEGSLVSPAGIPTLGRNVVVAGRSKNVGMPIAMLLHTDGRHERPGGRSVVASEPAFPGDLAPAS